LNVSVALPVLSESLADRTFTKEYILVKWFRVSKEVAIYIMAGLYCACALFMVKQVYSYNIQVEGTWALTFPLFCRCLVCWQSWHLMHVT
jgi:hypothetical protein